MRNVLAKCYLSFFLLFLFEGNGECLVSVPLSFVGTSPFVQGKIGEQKVWVQLNLSCTTASFDFRVFPACEVKPLYAERIITHFPSGEKKGQRVWELQGLTIGGIPFETVIGVVSEPEGLFYTLRTSSKEKQAVKPTREERLKAAVVLGVMAFQERAILIDYLQMRLTIYGAEDSYADLVEDWIPIPFVLKPRITIEPMLRGERHVLHLSTGDGLNLLGTKGEHKGEAYSIWKTDIEEIEVGGKRFFSGPFFQVDTEILEEEDGILGGSFFWNHPVLIDFPNQTLYIPIK